MAKKSTIPNDLMPFVNLLSKAIEDKQVFIFFHNKPDVDTLASAFALQHLLSKYANVPAFVAGCEQDSYPHITKPKLAVFKRFFVSQYKSYKKIDLNKPAIAIYVDFAQSERAFGRGRNYLPKTYEQTFIIDHHPMIKKTKTAYINTNAAANTELIAFMGFLLYGKKIFSDTAFAYLILKGIISDTSHLQNVNANNPNTLCLIADFLENNKNIDFASMNKIKETKTREVLLQESRLSAVIFDNVKEHKNNLVSCFIAKQKIHDCKLSSIADGIFLLNKINNVDKFIYSYFDKKSDLWVIKVRSSNQEQGLLDIIDYLKQDPKIYVGGHEHALAINFNVKLNENEVRSIHQSLINFLSASPQERKIKTLKTVSQLKQNKEKFINQRK